MRKLKLDKDTTFILGVFLLGFYLKDLLNDNKIKKVKKCKGK